MDIDVIPGLPFPFWFELIITIFAFLTAYIIGKFRRPKKKKLTEMIKWEVHTQIHEFLTELRVKSKAARAHVIQFHNGEYFVDGISMQKLSTTHESLRNGISSDTKTNVLITLHSALMEKLEHSDPILWDIDDEKPSYFKNSMDLANVRSYMVLPLYYNGGKSGLIMLQWCSDDKYDFITSNINMIQDEFIHSRNIIQTKLGHQLKGSSNKS